MEVLHRNVSVLFLAAQSVMHACIMVHNLGLCVPCCQHGQDLGMPAHKGPTMATISAGVARLYDLVRPRDERLRPAFFYAFGDTLVAADMEQASRIAYGPDRRWSRVVTIQARTS